MITAIIQYDLASGIGRSGCQARHLKTWSQFVRGHGTIDAEDGGATMVPNTLYCL